MIFVSLSRNNHHLTWVVYAEGHVIGRRTKPYDETQTIQAVTDLSESLQEAFKVLKGYLDNPTIPYGLNDVITIEVGSTKIYQWLAERDFADTYTKTARECLELFNELSIPVQVKLNKHIGHLWADKYNKPEYVTDDAPKVESALDWVSSIAE